jgi:hypothetical protein
VGKPEGRRPLGKYRCSLEDSIKMDLREKEWGDMDWIYLSLYRDQWKAVVITNMYLRKGEVIPV